MVGLIWLTLLVFIYIGLYMWNKKTPKPKGCENLTADCDGCKMIDCTHNPVHHEEENKND